MKTNSFTRSVPYLSGLILAAALCLAGPTAHAQTTYYSNLTNSTGFAYAPGNSANVGGTFYTPMVADDLNLGPGAAGQSINSLTFTAANLNGTTVNAQVILNFYMTNGAAGGPGTLLASVLFNPISISAGVVTAFTYTPGSNIFTVPANGQLWAGLVFSNGGGATATQAQLNLLGQGIFDPPTVGSSQDVIFRSTTGGPANSNDPPGALVFFGGNPRANFGWSLRGPAPVPDTGTTAILL